LLGQAVVHRAAILPRLGIPFVYDPGPDMLSMEAIASPPAYTRARATVRYDDVARTLVHALKYQDRTDLAPAMGRWMARAGRELLDDVLTSGATVDACTRALLRAKAASVDVLVFTRVVDSHRTPI
jgi:predicted amidophosphoribosyltransferase